MSRFHIVRYDLQGEFLGIMAGCGKNKNTWDSDHSRSAAHRHAADLRQKQPGFVYKVETVL